LVHWPLMGGLLHLVQQGGAWAGWGPSRYNCLWTLKGCNVPQFTSHSSSWRGIVSGLRVTFYSVRLLGTLQLSSWNCQNRLAAGSKITPLVLPGGSTLQWGEVAVPRALVQIIIWSEYCSVWCTVTLEVFKDAYCTSWPNKIENLCIFMANDAYSYAFSLCSTVQLLLTEGIVLQWNKMPGC